MVTLIGYWLMLAARYAAQLASVRPQPTLIPIRVDQTAPRKPNAFVSSARRRNRR